MNLKIAKWGNSLAVRIPAEYVRQTGIREGDQVEAQLTVDGRISDRAAFAQELQQVCDAMPVTDSVIEELRRRVRY